MATIGSMIGNANSQRGGNRLLVYAALLGVGICAAAAQEVQVTKPTRPLEFHIPSQPLAAALQAYGQRAGVQVLYESTSALGRTSVAVDGDFAPEAALDLLIAGTDLKVRYVRPDVITLAPAYDQSVGALPPPSGPLDGADLSLGTLRVRGNKDSDEVARLNEYSERVQMDIQNALRKNAKTRDGSYRAVLDLWIDPTRTIARTELFRSTGDIERDTAITTTLRGVTISRPTPANVPQPVRVGIVVKSLQ
jgi:Secretin and TonB N terminus short domain